MKLEIIRRDRSIVKNIHKGKKHLNIEVRRRWEKASSFHNQVWHGRLELLDADEMKDEDRVRGGFVT
ncbi:hypothetical protein Tco_0204211 [Tanacetum coccineum]